jgi:hypothetical protein
MHNLVPRFKKTLAKALALALFALPILGVTQTALASAVTTQNWEITDFHSTIFIDQSSLLKVTETIQADFTNERHHGIIRAIPYKYNARFGTIKNIKIRLHEAVNSSNETWKTSVDKESGYYNIRMETKDGSYLTGPATFHLTYEVERAINFFTEENNNDSPEYFPHDELYWNVTGTEWTVPITQASAEIHFPVPLEKPDTKLTCYTGILGSTEQNCSSKIKNATTVTFKSNKPLAQSEGLTIAVAMPEGTVTPPSKARLLAWFLADNWPLLMPLIVLLAMFLLWFFKGRDPDVGKDTVIPHYKPPKGLTPTECGTIIDEVLHPRDITSTIIDFAIRGIIKIKEIEKDYKLILLKDYTKESLREYEKLILDALFIKPAKAYDLANKKLPGFIKWLTEKTEKEDMEERHKKEILVSEIKNHFPRKIKEIRKSIMGKLVQDGYFPSSPAKTRSKYWGFGIVILVIASSTGDSMYAVWGLGMMLSILASAGIIMGFGLYMPRKTHKGRETYYVLKGLYEYMNTAEKDRMKFQEKANIFFEKLLPYAASFGLVKKWTKAFEGLLSAPPHWYQPARGGHFTFIHFGKSLNNFEKSVRKNTFPKGKSSAGSGGSAFSGGGGFSGGGFGGGGGSGI